MVTNVWVQDTGTHYCVRDLAPFAPLDRVVAIDIEPTTTPEEIWKATKLAYEKKGISLREEKGE